MEIDLEGSARVLLGDDGDSLERAVELIHALREVPNHSPGPLRSFINELVDELRLLDRHATGVRERLELRARRGAAALARVLETAAHRRAVLGLSSEVNIELNFSPKLRGARSRLYRRRFLQSKYALESSRRDLHNALLCTVP